MLGLSTMLLLPFILETATRDLSPARAAVTVDAFAAVERRGSEME